MIVSTIATLALALVQSAVPSGAPGVDPAKLGPRVGDTLPAFVARDQEGRSRDVASLAGANGLVLVFFRSADW